MVHSLMSNIKCTLLYGVANLLKIETDQSLPKEGFLFLPPSDEALQSHNLTVCLIVEVLKNLSKDFS